MELPHRTSFPGIAELHLCRLIGKASHPDMQKIRIRRFFFENRLHWQNEVWLLLFTVCQYVPVFKTLTTPDLKF
jgi:hypothetical protein